MKKSILLIAALLAAFTINAKVIDIDLAMATTSGAVTMNLENNELTVNYDLEAWGADGVGFALDNLDVTEIAFDYKGDASVESWVSFIVYLSDSGDGMWYSQAADLSISSWDAEWKSVAYMPADQLWNSSPLSDEPIKPFTQLSFKANPENPTKGSFAIRNVKVTVADATAIDNTAVNAQTVKTIRNGQMVIMRDGKCFNALGAEMK